MKMKRVVFLAMILLMSGFVNADHDQLSNVDGFPQSWDTISFFEIIDFNYDGRLDLFLINDPFTITIVDLETGELLENNGIPYRYEIPIAEVKFFNDNPVIIDIDKDTDLDMVVGVAGVYGLDDRKEESGKLFFYDPTDNREFSVLPVAGDMGDFMFPVVVNIDDDEEEEILITSDYGYNYVVNHDGSYFDGDGDGVADWPIKVPSNIEDGLYSEEVEDTYSSPAVGDIDLDGEVEIVVGSYSGGLYAFNLDGTLVDNDLDGIANWPVQLDTFRERPAGDVYRVRSPVLGDIDKNDNGELEIVVNGKYQEIFVLEADGAIKWIWEHPNPNLVKHRWVYPAIGDLDGDGIPEIAVGMSDGLYVFDNAGNILDGFPVLNNQQIGIGVIGDFSSHEGNELIVFETLINRAANIYLISSIGEVLWSNQLENRRVGLPNFPKLRDLNGDGDFEIGIDLDDTIYFWDTEYAIEETEWPSFLHDFRHTGLYESEGPVMFKRGDANLNGILDLTDAFTILNYLFLGGSELSCVDAADVDDSGAIQITDALYLLNYLFIDGPAPPEPGPDNKGIDPTPDFLDCTS